MLKSIIKGFSLLELVVVLAVMGTLAAVAVPAFSAVTDNSSSGALVASAKGIADQATSNAQSDSENPGRGVEAVDFGTPAALATQGATISGSTVTIWGQKDECAVISITGAGADAKVTAPVYGDSSVIVNEQATVCTLDN